MMRVFTIFSVFSIDCSYKFCYQKCEQIDEEIIECGCFPGFVLHADGRKCIKGK